MSKQTVKNEAFLDLEGGLVAQLLPVWERYWARRSRAIGQAADDGRWDDAHKLVEDVDLRAGVLAKRAASFETLGMAALLLGASRLGRVDHTSVFKEPPAAWLAAAGAQVDALLGDNATTALRHELHLIIDKREYAQSASNSATLEDVMKAQQLQPLSQQMRASGGKRGASYVSMAANLHVSRLSSAGFLVEASRASITTYQISEVLDRRTCPVCQRMHGKTFTVASGIDHLAKVFGTTDPQALMAMAPWPKQTKAGLREFLSLDDSALVDRGHHLPPYHPGCRGITVAQGTVPILELDELTGLLSGAAVAGLAPDVLGERLFGNRADLSTTASILFPQGATSALYGDTPPPLDPADPEPTADPDAGLAALGAALGADSRRRTNPDGPDA